jgi:hypothetical protein
MVRKRRSEPPEAADDDESFKDSGNLDDEDHMDTRYFWCTPTRMLCQRP